MLSIRQDPRVFAAMAALLLLFSLSCTGETDDPTGPSSDTADLPAVVDAMAGDLNADKSPVFAVDIPDADAARTLFRDGLAHFESPDSFQQVSWMMDAGDVSDLEYRVRNAQGQWTTWNTVEITWNEGHLYNALIRFEEPTNDLQLRGGEEILFAELEFFDEILARDEFITNASESPTRHHGDREIGVIESAVAPSNLVTSRAEWDAISPNKLCGSVVAPYRMAIHHTAVPDGDGGDAAARMRGMQSYHMNNLGWCDIGYHFVVAQSGEIFQGRSRSDRPGAHVGGQNSGNVGISFLANFNNQTPTDTQLDAGAAIMDWVHTTHGVPLNRNAVKGHREHAGQTTTCPGTNLMNVFDDLIARAQSGPDTKPQPPTPGGCSAIEDDDAGGAVFADFPTDQTGYDEAVLLHNAGITNGCNSDPLMFCPNCPMTRAQMAAFLARAADLDTSNPPSTPTFDDVPADSTFYPYIEAIAAAGITQGCGNNNFCHDQQVTRAEVATLIDRARDWSFEAPSSPSFEDVSPTHTHFTGIEALDEFCVTNGCGNGDIFCPDDLVPRAHGAAFIARAFNLEDNNPCAATAPEPEPEQDTEPDAEPDAQEDSEPETEQDSEPETQEDSEPATDKATGETSEQESDDDQDVAPQSTASSEGPAPFTDDEGVSTDSGCQSATATPGLNSPLALFILALIGLCCVRHRRPHSPRIG